MYAFKSYIVDVVINIDEPGVYEFETVSGTGKTYLYKSLRRLYEA